MSEIFGSVWWLLVTLGVLVTFHEFGHFWVARRFGVKVLRFSVGFGSPIWSRTARDGTEYAIGAIPLGGYVKFLDAREAEHPERVAGQPGEFMSAPPWQRIAIAAAGPAFNILFTLVAFWAMFVIGRPDYQPVIDAPKGLAAEAGFHAADRLVAVAGEKVTSWSGAMLAVTQAAALHRDVPVEVADARGTTRTLTLALSKLPPGAPVSEAVFDQIGLDPQPPQAIINSVEADTPAARGGMRAGDLIVAVNAKAVASYPDFVKVLGEEAATNPKLEIAVERDGVRLPLAITSEQRTTEGKTRWVVGITIRTQLKDATERFGPLAAVPAAFSETWKTTASTLTMIKSMLVGEASTRNLSSVISIAQVANASAHQGVAWFLSFLAMISLSLAILNLLPIPILDGGHIVTYLVEWIKGSPVSERTLIAGQYVGLALLVTLMSLALYNDIVRLVAS
ncbi:MAG: RIP metalloprotease RseP [Gammaproteobacteria bacterium]|nr:MAG: RIP metalloprotease RseP [Gammaproteobacteria bacterium]